MPRSESKHNAEQVLVVPAKFLSNVFQAPCFYSDRNICEDVLRIVRDHGVFVDRQLAENDHSLKQVVAYALIHNNGNVLCLRRSKKEKRSNLRLRYTILVGGHVDENEIAVADKLDACIRRELKEELGFVCDTKPRVLGVVVDPTSEVGLLHLGVVFHINILVDSIEIQASADSDDHVIRKRGTVSPLLPVTRLCRQLRRADPWTRLLVESAAGRKLFGEGCDSPQLPLPFTHRGGTGRLNQEYYNQSAG